MTNDTAPKREPIKATEVSQTSVGLKVLKDFHDLFGYGLYIPALVTGENRKLTEEQHKEKYPNAMRYLDNVKQLTKYVKTFGGGIDPKSYSFRVNHLQSMREFLAMASRLQFMRGLEDQIQNYRDDNVGWGLLRLEYQYKGGKLISTDVFLDDKKLDLSKPIVMNAINWRGELVDGIQLIDNNVNLAEDKLKRTPEGFLEVGEDGLTPIYEQVALPMNIAFQITDDNLGNLAIYEEREQRYGALNKSDPQKSMQTSPLDYMVVRIVDDVEDEFLPITSYETPLFIKLDYHEDIPFLEHARTLERYNDLVENKLDYNSRHFAGLNLFRWGILDKNTWDRGLAIFNAVVNGVVIDPKEPNDTLIDSKVVNWANAHIQAIRAKEAIENPDNSIKIDDTAIISGTHITQIASTLSTSYFIAKALVVTDIEADDLGFKDTRIAFRSRPAITTRFQSCSRIPTDLYKIVELDDDNNIIGIINPVDIFAIVRFDVESHVVEFKAELVNDAETGSKNSSVDIDKSHQEFYHQIGKYK